MSLYPIPYQSLQHSQKRKVIFGACLLVLLTANVALDYIFTLFRNSAFYISESLLFSTAYWFLFLPLLPLQLKLVDNTKHSGLKFIFTGCIISMHLAVYPALIWALSGMFYEHTFPYGQTFSFGLSAYFLQTLILYSLTLLAVKKTIAQPVIPVIKKEEKTKQSVGITTLPVTDRHNRKTLIAVTDIFYFSANSPYVNIYHLSRKYVYTTTLKSLENQLDNKQFVRIHKSHIVNISTIVSLQSRQNGDYDITLSNDTLLRVSRNYAKNFKSRFSEYHQLTSK
ncbi:LytTR family DNA-binding domain-containing protein [Empedobacter brevis]|uniref:LytTR family DNA-binding domain-containing protein n=2 Tax=Empedobacter brevis TaxID=247 RepID=UPI0003A22B0D